MSSRKTRVLIECPELIASARVGVVDFLNEIATEIVESRFVRTIDIKKDDIRWADIYVTVRGCESLSYQLAKYAKNNGRRIIYYLDDDLLHVPEDSTAYEFYSCKDTIKYMNKIMGISEYLWGVNDLIKQHYLREGQTWIENKIPCIVEKTDRKVRDPEQINIVYAGSVSHQKLVDEILQPAIAEIIRRYDGKFRFTFIGPKLKLDSKYIENVELMDDYDEYVQYMKNRTFEYGLAVVKSDSFYWHKYYNKYLEYARWGIVGLYTDSMPYSAVIKNGQNGILVENEKWQNAIENLIVSDCYQRMKKQIEMDIHSNFSKKKIQKEFLGNYGKVFTFEARRNIRGIFPSKKLLWVMSRVPLYWHLFGLKTFYIAPYKMIKKITRKRKRDA